MGDDFVYLDQYCSCSINIAYRFMSGSFRMPCVRSLLLCRLFCSIPSCVMVIMYRGGLAGSVVLPLLSSFAGELGIRGTTGSVSHYSFCIALFRFGIPSFDALVRIFRILRSSCIYLLCAHTLGTCSIALTGIAVCAFRLLRSNGAQCAFPSRCSRLLPWGF